MLAAGCWLRAAASVMDDLVRSDDVANHKFTTGCDKIPVHEARLSTAEGLGFPACRWPTEGHDSFSPDLRISPFAICVLPMVHIDPRRDWARS